MDTLDSGVKDYQKMASYLESDNVKRISRQQESDIHVVMGNPPYNAVQDKLQQRQCRHKISPH